MTKSIPQKQQRITHMFQSFANGDKVILSGACRQPTIQVMLPERPVSFLGRLVEINSVYYGVAGKNGFQPAIATWSIKNSLKWLIFDPVG